MAHPELDELLNFLLPVAQELLSQHGGFYPFAASIGPDGELTPLAITPQQEEPTTAELMGRYRKMLTAMTERSEIVACAVCFESIITRPGVVEEEMDAVAVELENAAGEASIMFLPYRRDQLGEFHYEDLIGSGAKAKYFA